MLRVLEQELDRRLLELARTLLAQFVGARIEQVDPVGGRRAAIRRAQA
jgi:hypothetical protein